MHAHYTMYRASKKENIALLHLTGKVTNPSLRHGIG